MAYITAANLRVETPFKDSIRITDIYLNQKIAEADSIINSKIGDVYTLPLAVSGVALSTYPDIIVFLSKEIASALVYSDQFSEEVAGSTLDGATSLEATMKVLEDIQQQKQKLKNTAGVELDRSTLLKISGYPDDSSTDGGDTEAQFTMSQDF